MKYRVIAKLPKMEKYMVASDVYNSKERAEKEIVRLKRIAKAGTIFAVQPVE